LETEKLEIGIDLVDVARMERAVDRWGARFLRRVFTDAEISYCFTKARPALSLAARFAAKEALAKTLRGPVAPRWRDVEVVTDGRGRPEYRLSGTARGAVARVSLSHTHEHAIAVALLLRKPESSA
jgi:holo-[acyl-carrier protein] synthase